MSLKDFRELILPQDRSCVHQEEQTSNSKTTETTIFIIILPNLWVLVDILSPSPPCIVAKQSHVFSNLHIFQTLQRRMENFKYSSLYLSLKQCKENMKCIHFSYKNICYMNICYMRPNCCTETVLVAISETCMYITPAQIDSFLQI